MAHIIYYDVGIKKYHKLEHPAILVDEEHPCYRIKREKVEDKIVFHWTEEQALSMYEYHVERYNSTKIVDALGEEVTSYKFDDWIKESYYLNEDGSPSDLTIGDLWKAEQVRIKIEESTDGNTEDD